MPPPAPSAPPAAVRVRAAVPDDLAALVALENRTFDTDRLSARQWRRHIDNPSVQVLVARSNGHLLGSAVVFFRRSSRVARLYSIAIDAAARGRGFGEMLLAAAERAAVRRGSAELRLEVRRDNAAAQRLYEKLGYRAFGLRPGYYEDGHDAVRYRKALTRSRLAQAASVTTRS